MKVINRTKENVIVCDCGAVIEYEGKDCHLAVTEISSPYYAVTVKCPACGYEHEVKGIDLEGLISAGEPSHAPQRTFAELTPKEIVEAFRPGIKEGVNIKVGDSRPITLKNGWKGDIVVAALWHDIKADGTKAPLTLSFKQIYDNEGNRVQIQKGNKAYTWEGSNVRQFLNNDLYALLPDEWKEVLTPVVKLTADNDGNITETTDKLYLPSEVEVFGRCEYSYEGEGEQLELFKDWINRIKSTPDGDCGMWWPLRSPCSGGTYYFCGVYSSGVCNYSSANYTGCVSPCFAIG